MLKRLSTVLLFGGILGLVPAAAQAAPAPPAQAMQPGSQPAAGYDLFHHDRDDHYRCMYRCGHRRDRYDRDRHYRHSRHRYCWYRDRWGWYQARCRRHSSYGDH
jgi:hypothetical protein